MLSIAHYQDASQRVELLTFLLDKESSGSWDCFLTMLSTKVVKGIQCHLISDKHKGLIQSAEMNHDFNHHREAYHFYICHIVAHLYRYAKYNQHM